MRDVLEFLLRAAGLGLLTLSLAHAPIARRLNWREEARRLSPVNAAVFRVHALFIAVTLALMGLPCLFEPSVFLERTRAGAWWTWSLAAFWALRCYCQWFVYEADLWRGKRFETALHVLFSAQWIALTGLFAACGGWQAGWFD